MGPTKTWWVGGWVGVATWSEMLCCSARQRLCSWPGAWLSPVSSFTCATLHTLPTPNRCHPLAANQEHPAIRKLLLPTLLADFRLIETWRPLGGPPAITSRAAGTSSPDAADGSTAASVDEVPDSGAALALPCPLAALGATQDPRYRPGQLAAWHACAPAGGYEERWFEGGHR